MASRGDDLTRCELSKFRRHKAVELDWLCGESLLAPYLRREDKTAERALDPQHVLLFWRLHHASRSAHLHEVQSILDRVQ